MRLLARLAPVILVPLGLFAAVATAERDPRAGGTTAERPFLLTLRGDIATLNYTPGSLDRAVHVQQRLELLGHDFSRWAEHGAKLRVFVLSRDEWARFGFLLPYGLPGRIGDNTLAVPSYGDEETVRLWAEIRGEPLEPLPGRPLKGTAVEAAGLALSDLMMEVEAVRVLLASAGLRGESQWLHQVLAHLVARTAFQRYEEPRLPQIDAFFASLGRRVTAKLPVERYAPGLDLEDFLWFESRFYDGARRLMESGKKSDAKALLKRARKNDGMLTTAAFFELCPHMRGWLPETFSATDAE